jgi:hypothetical protein
MTVRIKWDDVLDEAATIVRSYTDTSVTLRQLFYRLVARGTLPNTQTTYKSLSAHQAQANRDGWFPDLIDSTRSIHEDQTFVDAKDGIEWLSEVFRLDRSEGQDVTLVLAVEKRGLVAQLRTWFGEPMGVPVVELGGYCGQSHVKRVIERVEVANRPAILLYAGDFDPSGEDILRDFVKRTDCWKDVVRVALTESQVRSYGLPVFPGKSTDSRAAGFITKYGSLMQVEVDALAPTDLRALFQGEIDAYWDSGVHDAVMTREDIITTQLEEIADSI